MRFELPQTQLEALLDDFAERGWQSDQRFAESAIQHRAQSGYGPQRIAAELRHKGVASALIDELLGRFGFDWRATAEQLFDKRFTRKASVSPQERQRQYRYLANRGFPADLISAVLRNSDSDL